MPSTILKKGEETKEYEEDTIWAKHSFRPVQCKSPQIPPQYRACFICVFIFSVVILAIYDGSRTKIIQGNLGKFSMWFASNLIAGTFTFFLIFLGCTLLGLPGTLPNYLTGYIYYRTLGDVGLLAAVAVSFISMAVSSNLVFMFGRYACQGALVGYFSRKSKYSKAIILAMRQSPGKFGLLLRLCPIMVYSHLNYLFCGLEMSFKIFNFLHFGLIPYLLLNNLIGAYFGWMIFEEQMSIFKASPKYGMIGLLMGILVISIFLIVLTVKTKKLLVDFQNKTCQGEVKDFQSELYEEKDENDPEAAVCA